VNPRLREAAGTENAYSFFGTAAQCASLNVLIAGASSYTRKDGVNVVSLGHLCA